MWGTVHQAETPGYASFPQSSGRAVSVKNGSFSQAHRSGRAHRGNLGTLPFPRLPSCQSKCRELMKMGPHGAFRAATHSPGWTGSLSALHERNSARVGHITWVRGPSKDMAEMTAIGKANCNFSATKRPVNATGGHPHDHWQRSAAALFGSRTRRGLHNHPTAYPLPTMAVLRWYAAAKRVTGAFHRPKCFSEHSAQLHSHRPSDLANAWSLVALQSIEHHLHPQLWCGRGTPTHLARTAGKRSVQNGVLRFASLCP